jgi:hypothetical protein
MEDRSEQGVREADAQQERGAQEEGILTGALEVRMRDGRVDESRRLAADAYGNNAICG